MKKSIIELDNVWKTYEMGGVKVNALQGISLKIYQNEFLAILGPSGSGKSTILSMVGSLDLPTMGRVYLDGRDISRLYESDLAQLRGQKIGFIFQAFNLIPSLNALENVTLPMTFQDVPSERRIERAKSLLEMVGLERRLTHKPSELSGGERQRVAIARALANNPEIILADEPTGNLDSKTGREIIEIIKDLHKKENKTVILVTHDINLSKSAGRVCYLSDGKVLKIVEQ